MNIAIFVDGNNIIGLGHIYRSKELAKELIKKGNNVSFIVPYSAYLELLDDVEVKVIDSKFWDKPNLNIEYFIELLNIFEIVIFDLLEDQFTKFIFLQSLKKLLVSITLFEFKDDSHFEDLSFYPSLISYTKTISNCVIKSGPQYFSIRKSFNKYRNKPKKVNEICQILVTMGGADPCNILEKVIISLLKIQLRFECIVITGAANKSKNTIENLVKGNRSFCCIEKVINIEEYIYKSDIAIINGGITRYELTFLKTPYIAISIHDVQKEINENVTSNYGGINLGIYNEITEEEIANCVENLINNNKLQLDIINKMKKANIGQGSAVIAEELLDFYKNFINEKNK